MAEQRTILVIEDEDVVRGLVCELLEEEGFRVIPAAGPEQGLKAAQRHLGVIDMIFTDVMMPGMRGDELAARLVGMKPGVKVLYTSGFTEDSIEMDDALDDKSHFLRKPFTPDALVQKVKDVLDGE